MKQIPRDTEKWERLVDKYDKKNHPRPPAPRASRDHLERRHKGGGISRATLARMVENDLDDSTSDTEE